jgi:tetratricopeptide (TPR) repeat protein
LGVVSDKRRYSSSSKEHQMKHLFIFTMLGLCVACSPAEPKIIGLNEPADVAAEKKATEKVVEEAGEKSEPKLDFGDYSSEAITTKAWESLDAKKYDDAIAYAKACIEKYEAEAVTMQEEMTEPVSTDDKEAVFKKWALNDVGACYFIMGQSLEKQDKGAQAIEAYQQLLDKVSYAQVWDTQGWFWKPADAAKKQIKILEFDVMESE